MAILRCLGSSKESVQFFFIFGLGPLACSDSEFDFWNLWTYFWTFW